MPIRCTGDGTLNSSSLQRSTGGFQNNAGNWTVFSRFRSVVPTIGPGLNATIFAFLKGAIDYSQAYVWFGAADGSLENYQLEATVDGITFFDTTPVTITQYNWHWIAVTYNGTTHVFTAILDGTSIGTFTVNFSAITFNFHRIFDDVSGVEVCFQRAWSSVLTTNQLITEASAAYAQVSSGLLWDYQLKQQDTLTDHSGNKTALTLNGTVYDVFNYEFTMGCWKRVSPQLAGGSSPAPMAMAAGGVSYSYFFNFKFDDISITGTAGIYSRVDWRYAINWSDSSAPGGIVQNKSGLNPFVDPTLGRASATGGGPRSAWDSTTGIHVFAIRFRSSSYVVDTGTLESDGYIQLMENNAPTAMTFSGMHTTHGYLPFYWPYTWVGFQAGSDTSHIWLKIGIENNPTQNISTGALSSMNYVTLFETFPGGDRSAWQDWDTGFLTNPTPRMIAGAGAGGAYAMSAYSVGIGSAPLDPEFDAFRAGLQQFNSLFIPTSGGGGGGGGTTGTIILTKVTVPFGDTTQFTVATTNLPQSLFNITSGQQYNFPGLNPGSGYAIIETEREGWMTTYNVSNGSPYNNISVSSSETVLVTITNVFTSPFSGIYYLKPRKTNDTLYSSLTNDGTTIFASTTDVKFPDPRVLL